MYMEITNNVTFALRSRFTHITNTSINRFLRQQENRIRSFIVLLFGERKSAQ